ncbi:ribulose bisphosphate carboxylase small chain [Geminocystis sp. NIES-3708]|uniref:ribulose bisphosphate carboxylase small subunit n=1 Tax=Geminocystis sp. NIES-3708 TaxID=1615909 RepID=UPI0005FC4D9E|nr:ribulose bisphosphate carboxylase small subunit [Geminocystis sp. NIES-3708]BAQ61101.1 ribulose bisphosphate carboxylase small chain [Geminocystis sp. NIES-3708]
MQTLGKERRYETLSYLPPLTDQQIVKQVQYLLDQGFIPAIEFEKDPLPTDHHWTLWKLPLFNAFSPQEVLNEVRECKAQYSDSYIRVIAFDNLRQCQTVSFIVHKPNASRF